MFAGTRLVSTLSNHVLAPSGSASQERSILSRHVAVQAERGVSPSLIATYPIPSQIFLVKDTPLSRLWSNRSSSRFRRSVSHSSWVPIRCHRHIAGRTTARFEETSQRFRGAFLITDVPADLGSPYPCDRPSLRGSNQLSRTRLSQPKRFWLIRLICP